MIYNTALDDSGLTRTAGRLRQIRQRLIATRKIDFRESLAYTRAMKTLTALFALLLPASAFAGHYDCAASKNGQVIARGSFDTYQHGRNHTLLQADGYSLLGIWMGGGMHADIAAPDNFQVIAFWQERPISQSTVAWGEPLHLSLPGNIAFRCSYTR